eukprot:7480893-Alexandrium_andersonii.AAC.1
MKWELAKTTCKWKEFPNAVHHVPLQMRSQFDGHPHVPCAPAFAYANWSLHVAMCLSNLSLRMNSSSLQAAVVH